MSSADAQGFNNAIVVPNAGATVIVDPTVANHYVVDGAAGNFTFTLPLGQTGDKITIDFFQDSTGGRTVTFNGAASAVAQGAVTLAANATANLATRYEGRYIRTNTVFFSVLK